jgi:hypothetical protein
VSPLFVIGRSLALTVNGVALNRFRNGPRSTAVFARAGKWAADRQANYHSDGANSGWMPRCALSSQDTNADCNRS